MYAGHMQGPHHSCKRREHPMNLESIWVELWNQCTKDTKSKLLSISLKMGHSFLSSTFVEFSSKSAQQRSHDSALNLACALFEVTSYVSRWFGCNQITMIGT
jgi:hypothetical protein